jgi:hypothetical protein
MHDCSARGNFGRISECSVSRFLHVRIQHQPVIPVGDYPDSNAFARHRIFRPYVAGGELTLREGGSLTAVFAPVIGLSGLSSRFLAIGEVGGRTASSSMPRCL